MVSASMGMGKTTRLVEFVSKLPSNASILAISTRRSHCEILFEKLGKYGFQNYRDRAAFACSRIICQYESLCNLEGPACESGYDYILLDEVRSILSNTYCKSTNGHNWIPNVSKLLVLLRKPEVRMLLLDADLLIDGAVVHFLEDVIPNVRKELHVYEHNKQKRSWEIVGNGLNIYKEMRETVQNKGKIVVCVSQKKQGDDVIKELLPVCPRENILFYCGNADQNVLGHLKSLEEEWSREEVRVIIYSSVLTVAGDYNGPCNRIYAILGEMGCNPRELLQMTGRVRKPESKVVKVLASICHSPQQMESEPFSETLQQMGKKLEIQLQGLSDVRDSMTRTWAWCHNEERNTKYHYWPFLLHILQRKKIEKDLSDAKWFRSEFSTHATLLAPKRIKIEKENYDKQLPDAMDWIATNNGPEIQQAARSDDELWEICRIQRHWEKSINMYETILIL